MIYWYILVMAGVTYLIRVVPLVLFHKKIENRFVRSFLYYVPYACLTAMTIPDVFRSTSNLYSALTGLVVAVILALRRKSLLVVAIWACVAVFVAEQILPSIFPLKRRLSTFATRIDCVASIWCKK